MASPKLKMIPRPAEPATDKTSPANDSETTDNEGDAPAESEKTDEQATDEQATDEQATDEQATDEQATDEQATDEQATDEQATDEQATDESSDTSEAEDTTSEDLEKIIADRKQIEQANQRKLDEYKSKIDQGTEEVDELNQRFGNWYYVIANDVFQKIRLSRADLVKQVESSDDEGSQFRSTRLQ